MKLPDDVEKNGEFVDTVNVDVEGETAEVDVFVVNPEPLESPLTDEEDPFLDLDKSGLSQNIKRRISRLEKKAEVGSKAQPQVPITGYDVLQLVPPPQNLDQLAQLFELNSTHNAAVTMKSVNIAGLGYRWEETAKARLQIEKAQEADGDVLTKLTRKNELEKIALSAELDSFNDDEGINDILVKIWIDVESLGNGYLEIGRNRNGTIGYLGHITGQTMRIRAARDGFIQFSNTQSKYTFFRNYGDSTTANPLNNDDNPNEVMHFYKYSPNSTYYGIPDIIPAMQAVLGDRMARDYNIDYFENKAVPRYAFILKGAKLSDKAETALINYFSNELKGKNHGTLYIPLPASIGQQVDAEFKALEVGIQQASFIEYIRENRTEILMVHRVPPGKVSIMQNMNLAVSRDADKTFKEQVCAPEQRKLEKRLNRIIAELTETFSFKLLESDIIDADIKSRIHDRYARIQVMTPNEIRQDIGKPSTPDGNTMLPFQKGPNEGGPGQKTSLGAKPRTVSPADQTGQRQVRGQAQDAGQEPAKP